VLALRDDDRDSDYEDAVEMADKVVFQIKSRQ